MDLMIPLYNQAETPYYEQIYDYIKDEIKKGSLKSSTRLPSTRLLAENLKVSRSTTQMAYEQLLSEGYVESVPCKGYFVAKIEELVDTGQEVRMDKPFHLQSVLIKSKDQKKPGEAEYRVDFSPRGIDLDRFPFNAWRKITKNTLVDDNKEMFATGDPQGELDFREIIGDYLHSARGVKCTANQIIVGAGSEYLLMLISRILGFGRIIGMENPTYKQAYRVFESLQYKVMPVGMDKSGINISLLESSRADVAYVMPSHQYPTGIVMPVKRRQELLSWAYGRDGRYLIEDDYDSEFRYKGKPIPALQGMDGRGRVIYIGTFSKSIAPAIRVSYLVLPLPLLEIYQDKLSFYSSTVSRIDQNILYHFMMDGYYERHLNRMRSVYKMKHDALLAGLKPLESLFEIKGEYAGLHLLLTDKSGRSEAWLVEEAKKMGIKVYGLSANFIYPQLKDDSSTILLGYASLKMDEIEEGIKLLLQAWSFDKR